MCVCLCLCVSIRPLHFAVAVLFLRAFTFGLHFVLVSLQMGSVRCLEEGVKRNFKPSQMERRRKNVESYKKEVKNPNPISWFPKHMSLIRRNLDQGLCSLLSGTWNRNWQKISTSLGGNPIELGASSWNWAVTMHSASEKVRKLLLRGGCVMELICLLLPDANSATSPDDGVASVVCKHRHRCQEICFDCIYF